MMRVQEGRPVNFEKIAGPPLPQFEHARLRGAGAMAEVVSPIMAVL